MGLENVLVAAVTNRFTSRRSFFIQAMANLLSQDPKQNLKPVPDSNAQQKADKQLRDEFGRLYRSKDTRDKRELVESLLTKGVNAADPALKYTALMTARDKALETGDVAKAYDAVNLLFDYDVKVLDLKSAVIVKGDKGPATPESKLQISELYLRLADDAIFVSEFKTASKAAMDAEKNAKLAKNFFLANKANELYKALIPEMEKITALAKKADERLKANENDVQSDAKFGMNYAQASTTSGRYLAFARDDFVNSPSFFKEGSDSDLKKLGLLELEKPKDAVEEYKRADAWNFWADVTKNPLEKAKGKARTLFWLESALQSSGMTDDLKSKIVRGMVELRSREFEAPLAAGQLDVLKFIDLSKDKKQGPWNLDNNGLSGSVGYIQPAYNTPEEYDLDMLVQLKGKPEVLAIGVPIPDGKQIGIYFDPRGNNSKLVLTAGSQYEGQDAKFLQDLMKNGRPCRLHIAVSRSRLLATADNRVLLDWPVDYQQVQPFALQGAPDAKSLVLGCATQYCFNKVIVTEKAGQGKKLH